MFGKLTKISAWSDTGPMIDPCRIKDQVEVDFVLEVTSRGLVGVEVKAAATVRDGDRVLPFGDTLHGMPSALWW